MLWRASYFEEALKYSTKAIELDPLSWLNLSVHAGLRYASGDRSGGWADMQRVLKTTGDTQIENRMQNEAAIITRWHDVTS